MGPNGNRTRHAELSGRVVDYGYDDLYRLVSESVSDPVNGDRLTSFVYDKVGNRSSRSTTLDPNGTPATKVTAYGYDANDRVLSESHSGASPTGILYSYDDNGNTLSRDQDGTLTTYAYDSQNRLIGTNNCQVAYDYDAQGIRVSQTASGLTAHYLTDAHRDYAQVIEAYTGSTPATSPAQTLFTYGDDLIHQHRQADTPGPVTDTYHYDGIGSTRQLSNTAGQVTDTYAYTAFGELEGQTGTTPNAHRYTGEQYDPNLGFYYLRARYYNPALGRFNTC